MVHAHPNNKCSTFELSHLEDKSATLFYSAIRNEELKGHINAHVSEDFFEEISTGQVSTEFKFNKVTTNIENVREMHQT